MAATRTSRGSSPRDVDCPPAPDGCAAYAGEPCLSHGGTRVRYSFHRARTDRWEQARIDRYPAVRLVVDAAKARRGLHGKHVAELLDEHGHTTEAEQIRTAVRAANGHLSAKQAAALLLDTAEGGESR